METDGDVKSSKLLVTDEELRKNICKMNQSYPSLKQMCHWYPFPVNYVIEIMTYIKKLLEKIKISTTLENFAPQSLDHFKHGFKECTDLQDFGMSDLNMDFKH